MKSLITALLGIFISSSLMAQNSDHPAYRVPCKGESHILEFLKDSKEKDFLERVQNRRFRITPTDENAWFDSMTIEIDQNENQEWSTFVSIETSNREGSIQLEDNDLINPFKQFLELTENSKYEDQDAFFMRECESGFCHRNQFRPQFRRESDDQSYEELEYDLALLNERGEEIRFPLKESILGHRYQEKKKEREGGRTRFLGTEAICLFCGTERAATKSSLETKELRKLEEDFAKFLATLDSHLQRLKERLQSTESESASSS